MSMGGDIIPKLINGHRVVSVHYPAKTYSSLGGGRYLPDNHISGIKTGKSFHQQSDPHVI
jgi:hypothetical protein